MSGKVLMALARDNNGDIVNRGGGDINSNNNYSN